MMEEIEEAYLSERKTGKKQNSFFFFSCTEMPQLRIDNSCYYSLYR